MVGWFYLYLLVKELERFDDFGEMKLVFYNMVKQLEILPYFALYLNPKPSQEGELTIGGTNPVRHTGEFVHADVTMGASNWQFKMDLVSTKAGNQTVEFCKGGCQALVDSGAPYIAGPPEEIDELQKVIGAKVENDKYVIDCNKVSTAPTVDLRFGNRGVHDFPLTGAKG